MMILQRYVTWAVGVLLILGAAGCRDKSEPPSVVVLEGRVIDVNTRRGEITVSYYSQRHDTEVTATGLVTDETEIRINGVIATLGDVKVGEFAKGDVRVDTKGDQKLMIALHIIVERPEPEPPDPPTPEGGAPSDRPAPAPEP